MIDTVVIVVYDRMDNVEKWLNIWQKCETGNTRLIVIHNIDTAVQTSSHITEHGTIYIQRKNIGFDIGAFQDVCRDRLPGFPADWQQLLWCTDDTFPMQKDFLNYFALQPGEGIRAMEISPYAREHVRTTGFSISREVANKLRFPADPIVSKKHCWLFEHRWHRNTLMDQVKVMGLRVLMVAPRERSPLFDTGYHRKQPRDKELNDNWGLNVPVKVDHVPSVTVICLVHKSFPAVLTSFFMQTFKNWKLWLIHDGPGGDEVEAFVRLLNDDRIEFIETEKHAGNYGHSLRAEYLQKVKSEYVVITNADNYYTPVFLEYMLKPFENGSRAVASYCSHMIHSYQKWETQPCRLARGWIDCGGVLLKTKEAQAVGWHSVEHSADWFFFYDIIKCYGANRFKAVKGTLFVHN